MKKLLPLAFIFGMMACQSEKEPQPTDTGFLEVGVTLEVESEDASGRAASVNTDNFLVQIFSTDDMVNPVETFDPFSSSPAQIELATGEYIVTASSNDLVTAGFDSPYYYGTSDSFTIDKEETKTIDVSVTLGNSKVTINYSDNVVGSFTSYTGQVTVVGNGTVLAYGQGENRAGYFESGEDLLVEVALSYTKLDGSTIDRSYSTTITGALPKTQYNVNVDAELVNGQIAINVIVDDSVDEIDIPLTDPMIFLDDNGITIKAQPEAQVGDTGEINGVTYTVVSEQQLRDMIANDEDVTAVCTSLVTDMLRLFQSKGSFNQDIGSWDLSNVTRTHGMFEFARDFNQDISAWDISNVQNIGRMFHQANDFNQDISSWNLVSVTDMNGMFQSAISFNQDISSWNVSNAIYIAQVFNGATVFFQDLSSWDVSSAQNCADWSTYSFPIPNFTTCNP